VSIGAIAVRVFIGIWSFLVLWANFEAWFRSEKVMRSMQEDAKRLRGLLPDFWPGGISHWRRRQVDGLG
jgi:hypothetical protein